MIRALVIAAALALGAPACKGGPDKGVGPGSGTATTSGPCADVADEVRGLYRTQSSGKTELDADLLEANVHMVLSDCATDPERFVPCIRRAESVAALERDCLLPLDDEGAVEGQRFGK